jgi:hypothetical protein
LISSWMGWDGSAEFISLNGNRRASLNNAHNETHEC